MEQVTQGIRAQDSPGTPDMLRVGGHTATREEPDLLRIRLTGSLSPDEVRTLVQADRALWRERGYSLVLLDAREAGSFDAAARQASFDEAKRDPGYLGTTAVFGLSGSLRVLLNLVANALRLLKDQDDEMRCFLSEADARAYLKTRRAVRQQQALARKRAT